MASDTMASVGKKTRKPAKKLSHVEIHEAENGGHTIRHHFTSYEHPPEEHVFGKGESMNAHKHLAEHLSMPMTDVGAGEGSAAIESSPKQEAET